MAMTVMYNGVQFAPISVKQSIVVSCPAEVLWSVVGKFGTMALWMGSVAGQPIFSQLLGGVSADFVGSVRVFGIADKLLFDQLTRMDNQEMVMSFQLISHPMQSNPFPAAFVNNQNTIRVLPITLPGGSALVEWKMNLLTEVHHIKEMTGAMDDLITVAFENLIPYMNQSNSSGGHSPGSLSGQFMGSAVAPPAYGVRFMTQPLAAPTQKQPQPFNQAMQPGAMTGDSAFLQQPVYIQPPGQSLDSSAMPSQAIPDQSMPNQAAPGQSMPNQAAPGQGMSNQRMPNHSSGGSSASHYQQQTMPQQYPQQQQYSHPHFQQQQQQQSSQQPQSSHQQQQYSQQQQISQTHGQLSGDQQQQAQQQQQQQPREPHRKDTS